METIVASRHALTLGVVHEWAGVGPNARRAPQLGAGIAQCTAAWFSLCAATEEMSGVYMDAVWEPTEHLTVRDCWMAAVTVTLFHVQGEPYLLLTCINRSAGGC